MNPGFGIDFWGIKGQRSRSHGSHEYLYERKLDGEQARTSSDALGLDRLGPCAFWRRNQVSMHMSAVQGLGKQYQFIPFETVQQVVR